jgi:uncharacterized membrane protein
MNLYVITLLRLVHIVAGVFWVGGAVIHTVFIAPSVKATEPESRKFMDYFMGQQRFNIFMTVSSALTVLSGGFLFWNSSGGFRGGWMASGPGLIFTIGSVVGIIVWLWGTLLMAPRGARMSKIGQRVAANGGVPSSAQVVELHKLDRELTTFARVDFVLLAASLALMATARYWFF